MKIVISTSAGVLLGMLLAVYTANLNYDKRESECIAEITADLETVRKHYHSVDDKSEEVLLYSLISACIDVKEGR